MDLIEQFMNQEPTCKTRATSGIGIKLNQRSNKRKLEVWWSSGGLIEQIRDQWSTCKIRLKLGMANESNRDAIA
jgi:hypothetical protein